MMSGKKHCRDIKGPAILTPEEIRDIVENRAVPKAKIKMAKKYGVSENRVINIWREYYGGSTLEDYRTGLKKELPIEPVKTADMTWRRFKTERAEYMAKEPKIANRYDIVAQTKAKPLRKIPARNKVLREQNELDLDNIAEMGDEEAEIIAGEVANGNNSSALIDAIGELIITNKNLSESTLKTLKQIQKSSKHHLRNNSDNSYSEIDTDDSTIVRKPKGSRKELDSFETVEEESEGDWDSRDIEESGRVYSKYAQIPEEHLYRDRPTMARSTNTMARMESNMGDYNRLGDRHARNTERARPVYRNYPEPECESREEQGDFIQNPRYEQEISRTKYNSSESIPKQNYGSNYIEQHTGTRESPGIPIPSRTGSSETVPGVPWLKRRGQ